MPGSLQNKLQQFEITPPPNVWDKISRRLDEEFVVSDAQMSATLDDASITPPGGVWDRINAELNDEIPVQETPRKVVPLFVRIAVAAAVIGILFLAGLYFLHSNNPGNTIVKTVPEKTTPPAPVAEQQARKTPDTGTNEQVSANEATAPKLKRDAGRPIPKPRVATDDMSVSSDETPSSTEYASNPEEAPLYDLQTVSALQPVSVSAPPLRDKKGNIILDASLISGPNDKYITVTGPNGKQTRISSKFLNCLSYINANLTANEVDTRAIQCKTQFEEWRKKILAQPAFIPTANNFFDIFELKDLLQEM